ncbi:hypothetical protein PsorP6_016801 [Peronosclerospora sorghi]|uniref:Uncharacterized protein n=1 Tax=Peronosclerospora sorghi TaxID=230839 RepID=A0ACC0WCD2_9STRA|nr:hypothetical protein PsorP6_016801 [Peronosclerospora sorghi]
MTDPMVLKDVDQMLDQNVGLKNRFRRFIDLEDWEVQGAVVFFSEKAEAENFKIESETVVVMQKTFVELKKLRNVGNGRDTVWMWKELLQYRAQRLVK